MIGKVGRRGAKVAGLLRYLYGPGRANEHTEPHLVASWDGDAVALEPAQVARGRDFRRLVGALEQPLAAAGLGPADRPVYHLSLRAAPGDRRLSDAEWADVARDAMARTGLAPEGDAAGVRWLAVRHADDHVHVVATLARQDGQRVHPHNDFYRVGEVCRAAEDRLGLAVTAPRDRTAAKTPTRAEQEKGKRAGRVEPARDVLRREVRAAAAGSASEEDFLERLRRAGLLVRLRESERNPGQVTGYAVALPGDRDALGKPVYLSGGKLAADLTLPKLRAAWGPAGGDAVRAPRPGDGGRLSAEQRRAAWAESARAADAAAARLRGLTAVGGDGADLAGAASGALSAAARLSEGTRHGPMTGAADRFSRAAAEPWARPPARSREGDRLRAASRMLVVMGRVGRDEDSQLVPLLINLAALAEAVADYRRAQARAEQARAALEAAQRLRGVAQQRPVAERTAARLAAVAYPGQRLAKAPGRGPAPRPASPATPPPTRPAPRRGFGR